MAALTLDLSPLPVTDRPLSRLARLLVGLALYGALVVTHVDNVVRFVMQKRMADTHPLVTVFGVFVGLSLFGFMGVIFGPLLLAMFVFCVDLFKCKYLDRKPDSELFLPGGGDRA